MTETMPRRRPSCSVPASSHRARSPTTGWPTRLASTASALPIIRRHKDSGFGSNATRASASRTCHAPCPRLGFQLPTSPAGVADVDAQSALVCALGEASFQRVRCVHEIHVAADEWAGLARHPRQREHGSLRDRSADERRRGDAGDMLDTWQCARQRDTPMADSITIPAAPSREYSMRSTTVSVKFGSGRLRFATSSLPAASSRTITSRPGCSGDARRSASIAATDPASIKSPHAPTSRPKRPIRTRSHGVALRMLSSASHARVRSEANLPPPEAGWSSTPRGAQTA